jgi:hypothetical protein
MLPSFALTVRALTESIIREECGEATGDSPDLTDRVARFVGDQHARMPDYLRTPLAGLTLAFDAWAIPLAGRPFHRLPHERRRRQIDAWNRSALGFRRDLIRFYKSLVVFGWHAEVYGPTAT